MNRAIIDLRIIHIVKNVLQVRCSIAERPRTYSSSTPPTLRSATSLTFSSKTS